MPREIIYSVFVSSTYEDLREERAAVQKALLQLHCMPIGMELFGSADEETWDFIKRQIDACDYYVVVVADKYGSTAEDGVSYTEKEFDYAREIKKPVLAFVHGNRGAIPRDKTEVNPKKRSKLDAFIEKVRRSPVSFFTAPHDLATQVTVSFVNLRDRRPAVGFIRADQAPDLKRYADLLEENTRLREELLKLKDPEVTLFRGASEVITLIVDDNDDHQVLEKTVTRGELFVWVVAAILSYRSTDEEISQVMRIAVKTKMDGEQAMQTAIKQISHASPSGPSLFWAQRSPDFSRLLLRFFGVGLIEPTLRLMGDRVWSLTEYGQRQYGLLTD
jgi:hypothetical protein